jgi:hypothetical protein
MNRQDRQSNAKAVYLALIGLPCTYLGQPNGACGQMFIPWAFTWKGHSEVGIANWICPLCMNYWNDLDKRKYGSDSLNPEQLQQTLTAIEEQYGPSE